jgi:hypothetical protein
MSHVISIDKSIWGDHKNGLDERANCPRVSLLRLIVKMSALQTFMLVVDHDKQEARQIAERIAQGKYPSTGRYRSDHALMSGE